MQQAYAAQFTNALMQGLGRQDALAYDSPQARTAVKLRQNIYAFSSAKTLSQYQAMAAALVDEKGNTRSFAQFRAEAEKINALYNDAWLKTEYNTAIAQAEAADKWDNIQANKHILGCLTYRTMQDGSVRPEHAILDGIKRPVDDPWWLTYYPPNAFNCRCTVVQSTCGNNTPDAKTYAAGKAAKVAPLFKTNSGATKAIFSTTHPYFKAANGKLHELDAVKNYGMKNWQQIQAQSLRTAPPLPPAKTVDEFNSWWNDMVSQHGTGGQNFVIKDATGNHVLFDAKPERNKQNFFREHVIDRGHFDVAAHANAILQKPDEIWTSHADGDLAKPVVHTYIKYFKNDILALYATQVEGVIKAETCYRILNQKTFENLRKGYLNFASKSQ